MTHLQVNGWRTPARVAGDGPGLLLVHGWNASGRFWDDVLPGLARRFRVVNCDLLGCGDAPKPSVDLDLDAFADWMFSVAAAAGLESFFILGHSMGATIAIRMAERRPAKVRGLLLSNGLVHGPTALHGLHSRITRRPLRQIALMLRPVRPIRRWVSSDFSSIERLNPSAARDLLRGTYRALDSSLDSLLQADVQESLRSLPHRIAVLWSRHDDQLTADQLHRTIEARPEAPVHVFEQGGHCPMIETPEEYLDVALRLLQRL